MDVGISLVGLPASQMLATARQAEELGYSAIYLPDHWALEHQGGAGLDDQTASWEATTMLGALAAVTSSARIGALVHCNLFRHPGTMAQAITTLDHISGGRAILGLGSGWTRAEFEMMGAPFPDVKPRLRMLEESIVAIKALWTQERATVDGEFYHLRDAIHVPKPVRKPHPPVMLGGGGKGLLRIAARHADMVNIGVDTGKAGTIDRAEVAKTTDAAFHERAEFLRAEARAAGRDPDAIELSSTIFTAMVTDSPSDADGFAGMLGGLFGLEAAEVRRMPITLIGTVEECVTELRRRKREWGVRHYVLSARASEGLMERFARQIAPEV
ncbi:MAG TPA: LLM class flavin-dependent oxidoreductase [Candidatus Limnocylindrales bacterium]|nr:LLM class flavin-dependent oxidoreductase [Candidatus Limnocylindrales bacterium]